MIGNILIALLTVTFLVVQSQNHVPGPLSNYLARLKRGSQICNPKCGTCSSTTECTTESPATTTTPGTTECSTDTTTSTTTECSTTTTPSSTTECSTDAASSQCPRLKRNKKICGPRCGTCSTTTECASTAESIDTPTTTESTTTESTTVTCSSCGSVAFKDYIAKANAGPGLFIQTTTELSEFSRRFIRNLPIEYAYYDPKMDSLEYEEGFNNKERDRTYQVGLREKNKNFKNYFEEIESNGSKLNASSQNYLGGKSIFNKTVEQKLNEVGKLLATANNVLQKSIGPNPSALFDQSSIKEHNAREVLTEEENTGNKSLVDGGHPNASKPDPNPIILQNLKLKSELNKSLKDYEKGEELLGYSLVTVSCCSQITSSCPQSLLCDQHNRTGESDNDIPTHVSQQCMRNGNAECDEKIHPETDEASPNNFSLRGNFTQKPKSKLDVAELTPLLIDSLQDLVNSAKAYVRQHPNPNHSN